MIPYPIFIFTFVVFTTFGCSDNALNEVREDFEKFYNEYQVTGTFVLYDLKENRYTLYNQKLYSKPVVPASTFKICNSLIALETKVVKDEHFELPWDGIERFVPSWDKDHNLQSAFKNSVVWYYQEVARRIGEESMKKWLVKTGYGNADISGGIDLFWLSGGLRISPEQQIDFLKRLYQFDLPFSPRSIEIVKKIMVEKTTPRYTLRGKTGWSTQGDEDIGWYIGFVENRNNVYFFVNCIQSRNPDDSSFARARKDIVFRIFHELEVLDLEPDM